jgi:ribosomal protein L11 methyltransferase
MTLYGSFFMETHIEITIPFRSEEEASLLIATLSDCGYAGFLEEQSLLKAYLPISQFDRVVVQSICDHYQLTFQEQQIKPQNWNQEWESNFQPVLIHDFVLVRASFHPPITSVQHDLVINPKMSFGTGHHATTFLMIEEMETISFAQKNTLDFGTGTGVLAILAKKMGALSVVAIDNDPWSIENAKENFVLNATLDIILEENSFPPTSFLFDVIIANINKSILLRFLPTFFDCMAVHSDLLLSGILEEDQEEIVQAAQNAGFIYVRATQKEGWVLVRLLKK